MADPHGGGGGPKITPGMLFAFLVAAGVGILIFGTTAGGGINAFVTAIGEAKRRYPEVIMSVILLILVIAFMRSGGGGGGGGHG